MVDAGASKTMAILLTSLMITSCLISFFVMSVYGYTPLGFNTLDMKLGGYSDSKDFTQSCDLSNYTTSGAWSCDGSGMALSGLGELYFNSPPNTTLINQGGTYKVNYHLYPVTGAEYYIIVSKSSASYIHIVVKNDGLHIPAFVNMGLLGSYEIGDATFIPIQNANMLEEVVISTNYNPNPMTRFLEINFNGQTYTVQKESLPYIPPDEIISLEGVGSDSGIKILSMSNNFSPTVNPSNVLDSLMLVMGFVTNVLALLVWNIDPSILPWELNLMFIKTQVIGIFVCLIAIVRG